MRKSIILIAFSLLMAPLMSIAAEKPKDNGNSVEKLQRTKKGLQKRLEEVKMQIDQKNKQRKLLMVEWEKNCRAYLNTGLYDAEELQLLLKNTNKEEEQQLYKDLKEALIKARKSKTTTESAKKEATKTEVEVEADAKAEVEADAKAEVEVDAKAEAEVEADEKIGKKPKVKGRDVLGQ